MDILKKLEKEEVYENTRKFMSERKVMFLTYGGSHAYGTNVPTSDVDLRGIAFNKPQELFGLENFEQFVCTESDTTIYGVNKIFNLLLNCNPNVIEILGTKKEHHFIETPESNLLLSNKDLFLSKRAISSFGGYATAQLRRLENASSHKMEQTRQEGHILNSVVNSFEHLKRYYSKFTDEEIKLYIDKSQKEDLDSEIFMDINLKHFPLRDFKDIHSEMSNTVKMYAKIGQRNNKKTEEKLDKHVMHLIRLYLTLFDILEKKEINTYRENDLVLLNDIRSGKYSANEYEAIYEILNDFEKRLQYAKLNTSLPEAPDFKKAQELLISINKRNILF